MTVRKRMSVPSLLFEDRDVHVKSPRVKKVWQGRLVLVVAEVAARR